MILKKKLNIIILEDVQADAELAIRELKKFIRDFEVIVTDNKERFEKNLISFKPDIIISDFLMPDFDGLTAFQIMKKIAPDTPFIIFTGSVGEDKAVACLKTGVDDYVLKEHIQRLGPSVISAITRKKSEITHRKFQEELRANEELNRSITESTTEAIILMDFDGVIITWNHSSERMFGFTSEKIIGSSILKIIPDLFTLEREKNIEENNQKRSITDNTFETTGINNNNEEIHIEISLSKWSKDGKMFITAVLRDISERKNAEKTQSIIFNIAYQANLNISLTDLFKFIRNELSKIIDTTNFYIALYNKEDDTLSLPYISDTEQDANHIPAGKSLTKYVIDTKRSLMVNEYEVDKMVEQDIIEYMGVNSKIWLGAPLMISNEAIGVIAVQSYSDENTYTIADLKMLEFVSSQISLTINRKKKEEGLTIALEKAQESDKLKTAFLQNISHEIRTPMNGILGFTSLLSDPDLSKQEIQSYIDIINISGKRMLNTLNDLMEISRLDTGLINVNNKNININNELKELFNFYHEESEKKGLELEMYTDLSDDVAIIKIDKLKILSVLRNLIRNSLKYTQTGSIRFGYKLESNNIKFFVIDTGIGIAREKQTSIFERFVQADIEEIKVQEGTGLGLSISKAYIELMGGKIWLDSEINNGSSFFFTIPFQSDNSLVINRKKENKDKKLTVLIAEDEEVTDNLLTIILGDYCSMIFHAKNGEEALDIAKNNSDIDVILMDMKMPKMNGYTATEKIREFNKDVIIIAQTAYALSGDREKAIVAGCNDYITKPINNDLLIEKITTLTKKGTP